MTANERHLAKLLEDAAINYQRLNARQQRRVIRAVDGTRLDLADLLADFADGDGQLPRRRLARILRELRTIEDGIATVSTREIEAAIDETAQYGIDRTTAALAAVVGAAALRNVKKRKARQNTVATVAKPRKDGLKLRDRTIVLAGDYNDRLASVLRSGIIRGKSVSEIMREAKRVYAGEEWKLRRIVVTECNIALRKTTSEIARQSGVVRGIKLHAGRKRTPSCVELAEETDRHGLGVGIYLPDDDDIYDIHPYCTSFITYVLEEGGS